MPSPFRPMLNRATPARHPRTRALPTHPERGHEGIPRRRYGCRMNPPREKPHRLPRERYRGEQTVALTSRLLDRDELFRHGRRADDLAAILIEEAQRHGCDLLLACFMPDHLHVLLRGRDPQADALGADLRERLARAEREGALRNLPRRLVGKLTGLLR